MFLLLRDFIYRLINCFSFRLDLFRDAVWELIIFYVRSGKGLVIIDD